mmetsp:Transcript_46667/g.117404  ORF Transcript_46667/g.117404 Transcript_46667/m.117404 type:complete len:105 (-) Transcript_46667:96-410(-)
MASNIYYCSLLLPRLFDGDRVRMYAEVAGARMSSLLLGAFDLKPLLVVHFCVRRGSLQLHRRGLPHCCPWRHVCRRPRRLMSSTAAEVQCLLCSKIETPPVFHS